MVNVNSLNKIKINGIEFYYSQKRIKSEDIPNGYYKYAVRWADDYKDLGTIEPAVWVNHEMDLLTTTPLDFGILGYIEINEWDFVY